MELLDNNQAIEGNFVNTNHDVISVGRLRALKKRGTELNQLGHAGQISNEIIRLKSARVPGTIRLMKRMNNNQVLDRIFINPNHYVFYNARLKALKKRGKEMEDRIPGKIRLLKRRK